MKMFIVDAFTSELFMGNQAGVVILEEKEDFPGDGFMRKLAAELKHSETAFVKKTGDSSFLIRYFTPTEEVALCGHATISAFTVLRELGTVKGGGCLADTPSGVLPITVEPNTVWMEMPDSKQIYKFSEGESNELYSAFGLDFRDRPEGLLPEIINTGLSDILLPVKKRELLNAASMDTNQVINLSRKYNVVGIHMFCLSQSEGGTAFCRNFAPLFGIEEESATGTSSGGLTYYLRNHGLTNDDTANTFVQGEAMGKSSQVYTIQKGGKIQVGGSGKITLECKLWRPYPF